MAYLSADTHEDAPPTSPVSKLGTSGQQRAQPRPQPRSLHSSTACPVATIARDVQRIYEAMGAADATKITTRDSKVDSEIDRYFKAERQYLALYALINAKRSEAIHTCAASALGAQHQVMIASILIDELWDMVPDDGDLAYKSNLAKERLNWLLFSIIGVLEDISGVAREDIGAAYYMPRRQDPHLAVSSAIEVAS